MCNLYEHVPADEVPLLLQHYELIDVPLEQILSEQVRGSNQPLVYPKYPAPVLVMRDGKLSAEKMKWGMPGPSFPGKDGKPARPSFITNVRNTTSGHWKSWLQGGEVEVGKDKNKGGRCLVPATAFAEPDRNTSKPVVNRWFKRADGKPFFFASVWREWPGDHGTIKAPDVGRHNLFSFLTTEASGDVAPIHAKASPVLLLTAADVKAWLMGTAADALKLQAPAPAGTLRIVEQSKVA